MSKEVKDLKDLRAELDVLDAEIVKLYEQRMGICEEIAESKVGSGRQVQDVERERQKIESIASQCQNDDYKDGAVELFQQIMSTSRGLQYKVMAREGMIGAIPFEMIPIIPKKKARVVYQGVEGAYSQAAMFQFFGEDVLNYNVKTFDDAMKAICGGMADYAVLPIENSTAGLVSDVYDLLMHYDNYIVGETYINVNHALLGLPGTKLEDVKHVYSHVQGIMQCSKFLDDYSEIETHNMANTAVSAKKIVEDGDKSQAAIARAACAELYGLEVIKDDIIDNPNNATRFIIVSSKKIYCETANKISICFEAAHQSGSLYRLLSHLVHNDLSMIKIESRPVPGKAWEYRFFVDFEGNLSNASVKNALRSILEEAIYFKIIGNY